MFYSDDKITISKNEYIKLLHNLTELEKEKNSNQQKAEKLRQKAQEIRTLKKSIRKNRKNINVGKLNLLSHIILWFYGYINCDMDFFDRH